METSDMQNEFTATGNRAEAELAPRDGGAFGQGAPRAARRLVAC